MTEKQDMGVVTLLPCPFCKWELYAGTLDDGSTCTSVEDGVFWIECPDCFAQGPLEGSEAEAIAAWNHRLASQADQEAFQQRVQPWLMTCFGEMIAGDREERNHRFLEESLELVQSCGCTASEAHQLVDYVYGRPVGELHQEVGGVMVTLAALCLANDADMHAAGWVELDRIWGKVEAIRAKQAVKPKHSPLPEHVALSANAGSEGE